MALHPLAGKPAPKEYLIDVAKLERDYFELKPNPANPLEQVAFGTSGHRGTSTDATFTETHILATTQAIVDYRRAQAIEGPLFLGKDSHALSTVAQRTALEVLAANGIETMLQQADGMVPTPVISHAILTYNATRGVGLADGIIITPSHNPPSDGGFKYNSTEGGPADTGTTDWIQNRANELILAGLRGVNRIPYNQALAAATTHAIDYVAPFVEDLVNVIDFDVIRAAGLRLGIDPLGGASLPYWAPIAERYGLNLTVVNKALDPTFAFMTLDHDGKIRMDCSSPYAMASLV